MGNSSERRSGAVNSSNGYVKKESGVRNRHWLRKFKTIGLILALGVSMTACASLFSNGESWKEEVLLHDGSKLIVERSQTRGGNHEIGQEVPIAEHKISFKLPDSDEAITWKSTYGYDRDHSNLILNAIDVFNGVPFIVTTTTCLSYNKWDRPNPPYVLFKYVHKVWQRVPLDEFPAEIKEANVVINIQVYARRLNYHSGIVSVDEVKNFNEQSGGEDVRYLRTFVREPIKNVMTACSKFD